MYVVHGDSIWNVIKIKYRLKWCQIFHRDFIEREDETGKTLFCNKCKMVYWWEKQN